MKYALEVYSLTKKIKDKNILTNISFKIKNNTIFGIVGPNGSGKTTLIRIITGLYKSSRGFYKINGITYDNKNIDGILKNISWLIESPKFYENLTGKQNLELIDKLYNNNLDLKKIIEDYNMKGFINKKVKYYSLGMKQKLALSSILCSNSKLIILDEPTNGYDPYEILKFKKQIKDLKNTTVIICTHDLSLIESLCDEVMFLKNGRIIDIKKKPFQSIKELEKMFLDDKSFGEI